MVCSVHHSSTTSGNTHVVAATANSSCSDDVCVSNSSAIESCTLLLLSVATTDVNVRPAFRVHVACASVNKVKSLSH
jgi:hypothetical protein